MRINSLSTIVVAAGAFLIGLPSSATAELPALIGTSRYVVSCQSTETADMKDALKRKFSVEVANHQNALRDKKVTVKVKYLPNVSTRTVDELVEGLSLAVDPVSHEGFVAGTMSGIGCYNDATVTVTISGITKSGQTVRTQPVISQIRIPGSYAIKSRIE